MSDATRSLAPDVIPTPGVFVPDDAFTDEPERYVVEGKIGAGGMGSVFAAKSDRLGRMVAVKVVTADRDDLRRRFEREAEVTARLQHPTIVPVYGTGRGRDGRPFYAMKQVTGEPLDRRIAACATFAERLALLPNVTAVCDAIAYAHTERVIHRDLKPANILVGKFGETVVIDWGLVKDLRAEEPEDVSPYRTAAADGTALGKVMGTPAYMPIEQARGEPVDERADVYALGAILYHLLAGIPPYARTGETGVPWESMLARVIVDVPAQLVSIVPEVPPDLLAIVARAMARSAADRYPSAAELAEDLRRFQTGQLVGAHRYTSLQLVRRWIKRHRAAVLVGLAAFAIMVVVGVVSITRIIAAREAAEAQQHLAEANQRETEDLMGYMLFELRDRLSTIGKLDLLQDVGKRAAKFYASRAETTDTVELEQRAKIRANLGDVMTGQGHLPEALVEQRAALAGWTTLSASDPANSKWRRELAASQRKVGEILLAQGDQVGAIAEIRKAVAVLDDGVRRAPEDRDIQHQLGATHQSVSDALARKNDLVGALAESRRAMAIFGKIVEHDPKSAARDDLATAHYRVGELLRLQGDTPAALAETTEAIAIVSAMAASDPKHALVQSHLASFLDNRARIAGAQGNAKVALESYRAALEVRERLVALDPTSTDYLEDLAGSHVSLGEHWRRHGNGATAIAEFRLAQGLFERLVAQAPGNIKWAVLLATAHSDLGSTMIDYSQLDTALVELRLGIALAKKVHAIEPTNYRVSFLIANSYLNLGDALTYKDDSLGALTEYEAALAMAKPLGANDPSNWRMKKMLAIIRTSLAAGYVQKPDLAQAELHARAALALTQELVAKDAKDVQSTSMLAASRERLGDVLRSRGHVDEAIVEYRENVAIVDKLLASMTNPAMDYELQQLSTRIHLGEGLEQKGDRAGAIAVYREGLVLVKAKIAKDPTNTGLKRALAQLQAKPTR